MPQLQECGRYEKIYSIVYKIQEGITSRAIMHTRGDINIES